MLREEITLTLYRPAQPGLIPGLLPGTEEDTWQVRIERGATAGELKDRVAELYGLSRSRQSLRRDVDSAPLTDEEPLACSDDGDVLHLGVGAVAGPACILGALDGQLVNLMDAVAGAVDRASQEGQTARESLNARSTRSTA